jgi:hypothetical protein
MPVAMAQAPPPEKKPEEVKQEKKEEKVKVYEPKVYDPHAMAGAPNQEDMTVFGACCCNILSIYATWPACLGTYAKGVVVCCKVEMMMCKAGFDEGSLCQCMKSDIEIIKPTICCKLDWQLCCLDARTAVPCDDEVPCMVAFAGVSCVKDYKCHCAMGEEISDAKESEKV